MTFAAGLSVRAKFCTERAEQSAPQTRPAMPVRRCVEHSSATRPDGRPVDTEGRATGHRGGQR